MDDLAPEALALLLPKLGAVDAEAIERVDGTNSSHEGQTFDYAIRRLDGQWLAVEVVRAWDESFLAAGPPWRAVSQRIEDAVRRDHPEVVGRFVVTANPAQAGLAKDQDIAALVAAIVECATLGPGSQVDVDRHVTIGNHTIEPVDDLRVYDAKRAGEWELGPVSRERFAVAVESNVAKMERAGLAGYETHLAVIHWVLGSTHAWREFLAEHPLMSAHPQFVWAIDLNVTPGTQGREGAELIWPVARS